MNRFEKFFADPTKKAFIPFFMLGDPTPNASLELIKVAIDGGAQALEIGIPFSDPIADGPQLQAAAYRALKAGTNFKTCLDLLKKIREYSEIPIGLMVYFNLLFQQGIENVHQALAQNGVDAILAVDLPLEESHEHEASLQKHGLGCIQLIAPNTPPDRARELFQHSTAFTYVVSRYGTTGVRNALAEDLFARIAMLRKISAKPMVVGFGIKNAEQVHELFQHSDINGVIIASAITEMIATHNTSISEAKNRVKTFVKECASC